MATVVITTTPVTLDATGAAQLAVTNTGSESVYINSARLRPGQRNTFDTTTPLVASTMSGSSAVDTVIAAPASPPGGPLQPWYVALANRHYARASVVIIGDSITEGQGATAMTRRYVDRLAANLRNRFPTTGALGTGGGRGMLAPQLSGSTTYPATSYVTVAGTPGGPTNGYGPKKAVWNISGAGRSYTYALTGTSADVHYVRNGGNGTFSWAVDGGAATNIDTGPSGSALTDGVATRIPLGANGPHTLTLAYVSGGATYIDGVVEFAGDEASGIMVHDFGHFGWTSTDWAGGNYPASAWPATVNAMAPALLGIQLGANDYGNNIPPVTFQANLQSIITQTRAAMTAPYPPVVLALTPQRTGTYAYQWAQYVAAAYAVAAADPTVSVLEHGARMPAVTAAQTYGLYVDGVHPSDKGHSMLADNWAYFLALR
jgi:lysophospholipase L1-like esterase